MDGDDKITVAFAEDHVAVRKAIISFVESRDNQVSVIIEADDGIQLLGRIKSAEVIPDICILDINMPKMDGYTVLITIRKEWPTVKFLILTAFNDEKMILKMLKAGANGYLLKNCDPDEIVTALQNIKYTGYHYSNAASSRIFTMVQNNSVKVLQHFTEREIELLRYSTTGLSYLEISDRMSISEKSVEGIRSRLFRKLEVLNRAELALFAFQSGLVPVESEKNKI